MGLTTAALIETLRIRSSIPGAEQNGRDFVIALDSSRSLLAIAGQQHVAVFRVDQSVAEGPLHAASSFTSAVCDSNDHVTAALWAGFQHAGTGIQNEIALVIGTYSGWLRLHAIDGTLLHRQQLHASPVLQLRARGSGMGLNSQDRSTDIVAVFTDAAARISGLEIQSLIQLQRRNFTEPENMQPLGFTKWELSRPAGPRTDCICVGTRPPTLQTLLRGAYVPPKLTLATTGIRPPFAAFEVEEHPSRGAIAMVSDIAQSLKGWIPSPMRRSKEVKLQPAEPATMCTELRDDKTRTLNSLQLAPSGALAVATDTLGRVLLLDMAAMVCIRMWKGYRDAQTAWLVMPRQPDGSHVPASAEKARSQEGSRKEQDTTPAPAEGADVLLVIYAPRKSVCDVYQGRHGPALKTLQCSSNCRLINAAPFLSSNSMLDAGTDCLLLDLDTGTLASVRQLLKAR